ncbi:hypothetical protein ACFW1A_03305 [Kitasatospora sp. NPDC058965]|uniref:hypothetical protein n=1 Tax=Kitasatospora sp. NPDC058965 TaxID=3346682 RepID=UPI003684F031
MILPLLHEVARPLLSVPGVLLRRDTAKDAALLVAPAGERGAAPPTRRPGALQDRSPGGRLRSQTGRVELSR